MQPNPVLQKLGFAPTDRLVIIHTDDIGMCQASLSAYQELWDFGLITSGAVMVPCPWFLGAAQMARRNPAMDLGVHLTLTSEWVTYRWGAISTRAAESGLVDPQGYFYQWTPPAQEHADPEYARTEMIAQVERAFAEGINVTHVDTHMGTVAHPKFMASYIELAFRYKVPVFLPRLDEAGWMATERMDAAAAAQAAGLVQMMEDAGFPLVDAMDGMPLDQPEGQLELAKRKLAALPAGITHFIIHPSKDTPELAAITTDAPSRVANFNTFMMEELKTFLREQGIHPIGYRQLKELIPA